MATKKRKAKRAEQIEQGPLCHVVDASGRQVYPGKGLPLKEAQRLADGLREPASIVEVDHE